MSNSVSFVRLMKGLGLARPKLHSSVSRGLAALVDTREVLVHTESCSTEFRNFGFPGKSYRQIFNWDCHLHPSSLSLSLSLSFQEFLPEKWYYRSFFDFDSGQNNRLPVENMSCYTVISTSFLAVHPEKTAAISRRHYWFPREMTSEQRLQKFHTDGQRHRRISALLRRET